MNEKLKPLIAAANHSPHITVQGRVAARNIMDIEHICLDEVVLLVGRLYQRAVTRKVADLPGAAEALEECLCALLGVTEDQAEEAEEA